MSKSALEVRFDAKNVVVEFGPSKPRRPNDKDVTPLKRRAPKLPPKNKAK